MNLYQVIILLLLRPFYPKIPKCFCSISPIIRKSYYFLLPPLLFPRFSVTLQVQLRCYGKQQFAHPTFTSCRGHQNRHSARAIRGIERCQSCATCRVFRHWEIFVEKHAKRCLGPGALKKISEQLRKELPGLRGYSETQLKDMRRFYEAWTLLDGDNSCAEGNAAGATTEMLPMNSAVATAQLASTNPAVVTAELQTTANQIDIYHTITIPNITEFPVEDFF